MQLTTTLQNTANIIRAFAGGGITQFREAAEAELQNLTDTFHPGTHAVERLDTAPPGKGVNVMMKKLSPVEKLNLLPVLLGTMNTMSRCGFSMRDKLVSTQQTADSTMYEKIEDLARESGAVEFGFARIDQNEIFQGYEIPYRNAIVFTVDMAEEAINTAPGYPALREVLLTYGRLGQIALKLTAFLREQGYGAYPGFPIGGMIDYVRVAEDAGIGVIGYHGLLISPSDGTRQRINVVYTNMEVPTQEANPHEWVLDFCAKCNRCIRECPAQAIYADGAVDPVTGRKSTLHYEKCLDYYAENHGCAVCVKVCPFSQAGYEQVQAGFFKKNRPA